MDKEAQVVAQLAAALPKTEPAQSAAYPEEQVEGDPDALKDPEIRLDWTVAKNELKDFFGVQGWQRMNPDVDQSLQSILEWATTETGSADMATILKTINDQMTVMGMHFAGDRLRRLVQFVKIRQQRRVLEEKERALGGR